MFMDHTDTVEQIRKVTEEIFERKAAWYLATDAENYEQFLSLCLNLSCNLTPWQLLGANVARDVWNRFFADNAMAANFILNTTLEILQRCFNDQESKAVFIETFASNVVSIHDERTAIPRETLTMIPPAQAAVNTLSANIWLLPIFMMHTLKFRLPSPKKPGRQ